MYYILGENIAAGQPATQSDTLWDFGPGLTFRNYCWKSRNCNGFPASATSYSADFIIENVILWIKVIENVVGYILSHWIWWNNVETNSKHSHAFTPVSWFFIWSNLEHCWWNKQTILWYINYFPFLTIDLFMFKVFLILISLSITTNFFKRYHIT